MNYLTVKESHYQTDLVVLKSKLESERIECRLKNELTTQVISHIPSFMVELQVPENKLDDARKIMIEAGEIDTPPRLIVCPNCDSRSIGLKLNVGIRIKLFFRMVIRALTLKNSDMEDIMKSASYKCKNCGLEFN